MPIITKFSSARGACQWDTIANDWVRDPNGQLVPVDPKTGKPLVEMQRCPTCHGRGKVPRT